MLARKVYDLMHRKDRPEDPKALRMAGRVEFPTLQQLAKAVVAENFDRYPHLTGVPVSVKDEVMLSGIRNRR